MNKSASILLFTSLAFLVFSAHIIVNYMEGAPESNTTLDISRADKEFLAPSMTSNQRKAIFDPPQQFLVYDTDTQSFWSYHGIEWESTQTPMASVQDSIRHEHDDLYYIALRTFTLF